MAEKRNPIAAALRSPHLRQQVVPNKKAYQRKPRTGKVGASDVFTLSRREFLCLT